MADTSISVSQDQFSCSICLDLLKDPVTIPCGHSYCMNCITDYWNKDDQRGDYSCPQCRQTFTPRPALNKNVVLAEMVEKVTNVQTTPPDLSYAGPGDVECDVCSGRKRKAVKSCLLCLESYCQTHFDSHEESRSNKRHKVTDATGRMQEMICSKHGRLLEVFCRTDQLCVCLMCAMDEHKNHDTISAEAERTEKRKQIEETVITLQQMILERQRKLQELRESVQSHKISAKTVVEDSERIFTELISSIERYRSEVIQMIRDQEKTAVSRAEGHLKQLELEIEDLKRRDAELEQLLITDDDIRFLQDFQSLSVPPGSRSSYASGFFQSYDDVRTSVTVLKDRIEDWTEEIGRLSGGERYLTIYLGDPKTRENFLEYFHQFTLDSESVNKHFRLSEGNRVATCTQTIHTYPDHPNRFDVWPQVLCRESVFGRCYWEVEWRGVVAISVSYKSISRKGRGNESKFGCNDQSWRLLCCPSGYFFSHDNKKSQLPVQPSCSRIGVFVDHRAGSLSFFSVSDTLTLIHRVKTTFTQVLYPGFGINWNSAVKLSHLTV